MNNNSDEVKQIATQLLAAMLSNPHIYANLSDEGAAGQQEQKLRLVAVEMARQLIKDAETP
ncbi:conserved hypothetical protein [Gloeothece citriformis PCC 7424]|uniref:Uncharacterized protein n=1 Tax=Gloeothece citriformis (strain PCC 7424) TaxID=65393 RepID=B7KAU0_GLOC7|nr:hypothetical protein [Gloeothece citriformis]ACK68762.1 conserved hypothetical protein [Gloeothece citriformis PCC 7424]